MLRMMRVMLVMRVENPERRKRRDAVVVFVLLVWFVGTFLLLSVDSSGANASAVEHMEQVTFADKRR